jgi:hypothetical protein
MKLTKEVAHELAKKGLEQGKKYGIPLKKKKTK